MTPATTIPLRGLLAATTALRPGQALRPALETVMRSVADALGFRTAALNLYRPATDDFEVVIVHGPAGARQALLGTTCPADVWAPLIATGDGTSGCVWIPEEADGWDEGEVTSWLPPVADSDDPTAWRAEDSLFVILRGGDGEVRGILSMDEPRSGKRPTPADLDVLHAVATQAGLVLEAAEAAERAREHRAAVQALLAVGSRMTAAQSAAEIAEAACAGMRDALGFDNVAVVLDDGSGLLELAAQVGRPANAVIGPWRATDLAGIEASVDPTHGCSLLPREEAEALVPPHMRGMHPSVNNGHGPHGWDRHWLLVPLVGDDDRLLGWAWPDDPGDLRVPSVERLQTLRAFANQAAASLEARRAADELRRLAEHDPLTGLRNRRGLDAQVQAVMDRPTVTPAAILVVDADEFKRVNDELGHHTGDEVLRTVAAAIRVVMPADGVGVRLGGEEFAIVLPDGGEATARLVAEALRRRVLHEAPVPWGLRLSVGIAVDRSGEDAGTLLRHASRALTAAKRLGRDRVVGYDPETIEPLLEALGRDTSRSDELAAVMLLAETLDLRDEGTARHSRTVGRYAEALARQMGLPADRVERIRIAGLLHDIGKLGIPDRILHKPGRLDDDEWAEIRLHPEVGARIVAAAGLRDVADWVLAHHEHWHGGGYPFGLEGAGIPLEARIIAVADAYEAMTAARPYRPQPLSSAQAREELRRCSGTQFAPDVVDTFLRVLR